VALITALLLVALATAAAVAMASRQQLDIRRITNVMEYDQSQLYVQGVEDWAAIILKRDLRDSKIDSLDETWAMQLPPMPVDGGQLAGAMEDMQGRFNVNSLLDASNKNINPQALDRFRRLLLAKELPVELADTIADWLDADDDVRMGGAEQVWYMSLTPPYRAFNGPIASVSELRLVKGMTPEIFAVLEPYLSALPVRSGEAKKLNVNTVPATKPELIMCLGAGITQSDAVQYLENRGKNAMQSPQDFADEPSLRGKLDAAALAAVDVKSSYFMVTSHVQVGRSTFTTYSLLERNGAGARTVMRAQGTY
jgi:general secretion pathway protein K